MLVVAALLLLWGIVFIGNQGPADCGSEAGIRPENSAEFCPSPRSTT